MGHQTRVAFSFLVLATLSEVPAAAGGHPVSFFFLPFYAAASPRRFSQKSNPYRVQLTTLGTPGYKPLDLSPTVFCAIPNTKSVSMAKEQYWTWLGYHLHLFVFVASGYLLFSQWGSLNLCFSLYIPATHCCGICGI